MSRPATSRLKVNPPLGLRPSLEFRRVEELKVDPAYQRSIGAAASQTLIRRIAMFWDWGLCQPLAVARREDGGLYVVDGQHRLEAARLRGDIGDLPCVVSPYSNAGDEAAAFVALNQQRRPLGAIDLFKAALAAEDETATKVAQLLNDAGLSLAPHSNFISWKPGMVSNIAGILGCLRVHGERITALSLEALAKGFEGQVLRYAGSLFPGIYSTVAQELRFEGTIDMPKLARVLRARSQGEWKQEIALEQASAGVERKLAAKKVVATAYRQGSVPRPIARPIVASPQRVPAKAKGPQLFDPERLFWCDQCDRRRRGSEVNACADKFCKARPVAAAAA